MVDKTIKNVALGALGGITTDAFIDVPIAQAIGYVPAIQFHEGLNPNNPYIWGIGLGDLITAAIGAGLIWYGGKRKASVKEAGYGWLLGLGTDKLVEFYNYVRTKLPPAPSQNIVPLQAATPIQMRAPAAPQPQLIVGSKSGGPTTVYKPNVSAPPCAGTHANDPMLFV